MRSHLYSLASLCVAIWLALVPAPRLWSDPPNVVFIYIDDLGFADIGFNGAPHYRTPHIDAWAASGMVFTSAYAAAPNCAPSRACLMTGMYTPRHGVYTVNNSDRGPTELRKLIPVKNTTVLDPELTTLGELFQQAGYATAYVGKWHLGKPGQSGPSEQGFDVNIAGNQTGSPKGGHFSPFENPQLPDPPEGRQYLTDRLTDEAIAFIGEHREQPFFLFLSHYAVHTPIQAPAQLTRNYRDTASEHGINAKYAAMIESVDNSVGAIMDTLVERELQDNTMVVFYSDNGGHGKITSNAPLRGGKGMFYEGGIRVPLAISWPGKVAAGSRCDTPVIGTDFFAMFEEMLDLEASGDQPCDGQSLITLLTGQSDSLERALYWHFPAYLQGKDYPGAADNQFRTRPCGVIRQGDWKLIVFFEDQRLELYNLTEDFGETTNAAEENPEIALRLLDDLRRWRERTDAQVPSEPNPEYQPEK